MSASSATQSAQERVSVLVTHTPDAKTVCEFCTGPKALPAHWIVGPAGRLSCSDHLGRACYTVIR